MNDAKPMDVDKPIENTEAKKKDTVSPMTPDNLFVITELAKIGLDFLTSQLPSMKEAIEKKESKLTEENYKHYESLAKIAGSQTVSQFDRICQYIYEDMKKAVKKDDTSKTDANPNDECAPMRPSEKNGEAGK